VSEEYLFEPNQAFVFLILGIVGIGISEGRCDNLHILFFEVIGL
jgi:hypothetical protein